MPPKGEEGVPVVLALGSNLGDRAAMLRAARDALEGIGVEVRRASAVIETPPLGPPQPDYLNQVVQGWTTVPPRALLAGLQEIERTLGRVRGPSRWGPRPIDIDILLYGDERVDEPDLQIPHRELADREFVLVPWAELEPDRVVPGLGRTVRSLLEERRRNRPRVEGGLP